MDVMAVNFRVCRVFDRMLRLVVCQWIALGRLAFQHGWLEPTVHECIDLT